MDIQGIEIRCPRCRGELESSQQDALDCLGCHQVYPMIMGIPDLRVFPDPYIGIEEDRAKARRLAERFNDFDFEGFVYFYYTLTSVVPPQHARQYTRGLLAAQGRAENWLKAWETQGSDGPADSLLEIGCGTAPVLAAAKNYRRRVGVDIAFRWLIVGKKRLVQAGADLPLICACAEALPFCEESFDRVVADSAIEHFRDQRRSLDETYRVLRQGGKIFVATPNRFSLGPDPQTGLWAGSWLPGSWTAALVRRQGGIPPVRRLRSVFSLKRLLSKAGFVDVRVFLPGIPDHQRAQFPPWMNFLMAAYDLVRRFAPARYMLYLIGPLIHAVATKQRVLAREGRRS
jgi:SAM-dependent methyltransferase